ncbi:MAG: hypothetical protein GY679_05520 [Mycoplasma sp.]|nr:hypothetical protein [Mycoplasma sp.]
MVYSITITIFLILLFFATILCLGKWFQTQYNIFNENIFVAPIIGFILFCFFTLISYLIPFALNVTPIIFVVFELLKDVLIFLFLIINKHKINFKGNFLKIGFIILAASLLINIPFLLNGNIAYSITPLPHNEFNHIFKIQNINQKIIRETWVVFNSIIIFISEISARANIYWMQGVIVSILSVSVICSYIFLIFKKMNLTLFFSSFVLTGIVLTIVYFYKGNFNINCGSLIILLTTGLIGWEIISRPQVSTFWLSSLTIFCAFAFKTELIWLFCFYNIILGILYIYMKRPRVFMFLFIHIITISIVSLVLIFAEASKNLSLIILLLFSIALLFIFILRKRIDKFNYDALIYKIRHLLLFAIVTSLIVTSITLNLTMGNTRAPWFHFGINSSIIKPEYFNNKIITVNYILYNLIILFGIIKTSLILKNKRSIKLNSFLYLFGTAMGMLLFTPLTYPTISLIIGKDQFGYIIWISVFPIIIGIISEFKEKNLVKKYRGYND